MVHFAGEARTDPELSRNALNSSRCHDGESTVKQEICGRYGIKNYWRVRSLKLPDLIGGFPVVVIRGRAIGAKRPPARLSFEQVLAVRFARATSRFVAAETFARFGVACAVERGLRRYTAHRNPAGRIRVDGSADSVASTATLRMVRGILGPGPRAPRSQARPEWRRASVAPRRSGGQPDRAGTGARLPHGSPIACHVVSDPRCAGSYLRTS
jgi:hypothetical protein